MATSLSQAIERLCGLTLSQGLTDGDLLHRFLREKDTAAFETLVARHGPMVLAVCRRILKNGADADDAFQATFLVLLRTARSIRKPASLASWLHGVARRTALHAKRSAARRRVKEAAVVPKAETAERRDDLGEVLDEELAGLPEAYRAAIIPCDREGKTRKEAARELSCAEGTAASRLSRGRSLLAGRLSRRGVTLATGATLCSAVPAALVASTLKLAVGAVSAPVAALTQGVLKVMLLDKLRRVAGGLVLLAVLAVGLGLALPGRWLSEADSAGQAKEEVLTVSLQELSRGYAANHAAGDEQFAGRRVRVTGYFGDVKRVGGLAESPVYLLTLSEKGGKGQFYGFDPSPTFQFGLAGRKQLAGLKDKQRVTVEGRCEGPAGQRGILIRDCRVVAVEPAPSPEKQP